MSLEEEIRNLTVAVNKNNELLANPLQVVDPTPEKKETAAAKKKRLKAEAEADAALKPEGDDFGLGDEAPEEVTDTEPQMTIDDIEDVLRVSVKNKKGPKAREIFTKYDAEKLSDIKDEDINAFYADMKTLSGE